MADSDDDLPNLGVFFVEFNNSEIFSVVEFNNSDISLSQSNHCGSGG